MQLSQLAIWKAIGCMFPAINQNTFDTKYETHIHTQPFIFWKKTKGNSFIISVKYDVLTRTLKIKAINSKVEDQYV